MFKVKNGLAPLYITEFFKVSNSHYNLPNVDFSQVRFNSVQNGKHSLRYFGAHLWSRLTPNDKAKNSLKDFKNNIRKRDLTHLLENCSNCTLCTSS